MMIHDMNIPTVFLQKEELSGDYSIIYNTLNKDTSNSELEAVQAHLPPAAWL
jgi:DNA-directed RNA polymerase subunit beta